MLSIDTYICYLLLIVSLESFEEGPHRRGKNLSNVLHLLQFDRAPIITYFFQKNRLDCFTNLQDFFDFFDIFGQWSER
jgi:hypothetical protein